MILTFDIGATSVKTGIFDKNSNCFLNEKTYKTEHDTKNFKNLINKIVEDYLNDFNFKKIGIGFPGNITDNGEIIFSPNLPFLKHENIIKLINNNSFSIKYENDANCAALGSLHVFNKNDIVTLTLGTGIGGGIIIKKQLLNNFTNTGFEFGHITVKENGAICSCGKAGCMEAYSSAAGMISLFRKNSEKKVKNFKELFELYSNGNVEAKKIIEQGFHYLGVGASIIANIFAPEILVFTGGITNKFKIFKNSFSESFNKYTLPFLRNKIKIEIYTKNNLGLIGAAALFL
jgi:glucokinase